MWVTLRYWIKTYVPQRSTFTDQFEYPEKPMPWRPGIAAFTATI